jgi:hypothetical protein
MRGDELARPWGIIWAIKASPNGLAAKEIKQQEETIRTIYRNLRALLAAEFPLYTRKVEKANRWAFIGTFKFKIPAHLALSKLMSIYPLKGLVRKGLIGPVIRKSVGLST